MEKECCQIKITRTDEGMRIDITGEGAKNMAQVCCVPMACCSPGDKEKKES